MFTIRDVIDVLRDARIGQGDDGNSPITGCDLWWMFEDAIADDIIPNEPRYHALARAALRLPEHTIRRIEDQRPPFA